MRAIVQRVSSAKVSVSENILSSIGEGYLVLLGVKVDDTLIDALFLARKIANLRVFEDANGKMNRSIKEVHGVILSISQFTLYGDVSEGNRPSFINAAQGDIALPLYNAFNHSLRQDHGLIVETGAFGEDMAVELINKGPVTIIIDSRK
jgi:D-tyrosyl-tRNA(Tyr) deacylase